MKILCLGDVVGEPGRNIVIDYVYKYSSNYDFIIVNGENSAGGFGITSKIAEELFKAGVDVITTGNHIWDQKEIYEYLKNSNRVLRPYNYPSTSPGKGIALVESKKKQKVSVINIQGSVFMSSVDNPFNKIQEAIAEIGNYTKIIIVDFHAEATSEKLGMGWFLDGKVSLVFGTHTHVPTADERILNNGTGYITDLGMCGSYDSIIGMKKEGIINKFLTSLPSKFEVANQNVKLSGIEVDINEEGKCKSIRRIFMSSKDFI